MSGTTHLRESQVGSYRFGFLEGTADHAAGRLGGDLAVRKREGRRVGDGQRVKKTLLQGPVGCLKVRCAYFFITRPVCRGF